MVMNDMTDDGKWGAPIPIVHGRRPNTSLLRATEWQWSEDGRLFVTAHSNSDAGYDWSTFDAIRLPANHPHYQNTQTTPNLGATLTAQERLERMEAFVRKAAAHVAPWGQYSAVRDHLGEEARALVAEMEPVDPDLVEARQIEHDILVDNEMDGTPALRGEWDDKPGVRGVLRAIKRGRELARGDAA